MNPLRILITGSREWKDKSTIAGAIFEALGDHAPHLMTPGEHGPEMHWDQVTVVHGAAKGADTIAGRLATAWGMRVECHPADWAAHGKAAGFRRNAEMVNLGADVCLAFIRDRSRGATHTAELAEAAGIPTKRFEVL